jgi:replicative DNA helicase
MMTTPAGNGDVSKLADYLPPQNLEAERWLLGGILLDNRVLDEVEFLTADDFYREAHQVTFRAMTDLHKAGVGVDTLTGF